MASWYRVQVPGELRDTISERIQTTPFLCELISQHLVFEGSLNPYLLIQVSDTGESSVPSRASTIKRMRLRTSLQEHLSIPKDFQDSFRPGGERDEVASEWLEHIPLHWYSLLIDGEADQELVDSILASAEEAGLRARLRNVVLPQGDDVSSNDFVLVQAYMDKDIQALLEAVPRAQGFANSSKVAPLPLQWYAVHSHTGHERLAQRSLLQRVVDSKSEDWVGLELWGKITRVVVPLQSPESKRAKLPGYIFVQMLKDQETLAAIRTTPRVTGFVGGHKDPAALSDETLRDSGILAYDEIQQSSSDHKLPDLRRRDRVLISAGDLSGQFGTIIEINLANEIAVLELDGSKEETEVSLLDLEKILYEVQDDVTIKDGPFARMNGVVTDVNHSREKLKVTVTMFNRPTSVVLDFQQVEKI